MAKTGVSTGNESNVKNWWGNSKQNIVAVINELKKVYWPGRTQLIAYTGVVLFAVAIIAVIIWLFDSGLSWVLDRLMTVFV
ncbi:MAG: preprotein translocase subunit SecE [Syntrophomonas sp.]|nr:preprotein translocase subunit SecE [Syntrophomonas sp.]